MNLGFRYERLGDFATKDGRNTGFGLALANANPPGNGSQAGYVLPSNSLGPSPMAAFVSITRGPQLAQAEENLQRLKEEVEVGIERSYNKLQETRHLVQVSREVLKLRQEGERVAGNQLKYGVALVSDRQQATAATYKAQVDLLQSSPGYLLAWAELELAVGRTPGY